MYDPFRILAWLTANVHLMRHPRQAWFADSANAESLRKTQFRSRVSRSLAANISMENGFWMNCTFSSSTPWRAIRSAV
jgi:hypothetical protein